MTTPISNRLHIFAVPLMEAKDGGDFVCAGCGDSQFADCLDSSSNKYVNYMWGIVHSWFPHNPTAWSGICLKGAYVSSSETHTAFGADSSSNCTLTLVAPGATAGCGIVAPSPKQCRQFQWTGNLADGVSFGYCDLSSGERTITFTANTTGSSDVTLSGLSATHRAHNGQTGYITGHSDAQLNDKVFKIQTIRSSGTSVRVQTAGSPAASDASYTMRFPSQWACGDWFSGVHLSGRVILHKSTTAGMLSSFSVQARRDGSGLSGSLTGQTAADTNGLTYIEKPIGNASGYPGIGLVSTTGHIETGTYMLVSGYSFFRTDGAGGARSPGFYICDFGQTGMTTMGLLGSLGSSEGSLASNVPEATVLAYLAANHNPSKWIVRIGYNAISSGDYDEVNGGVASGAGGGFADGSNKQFKHNMTLILNQIRRLYALSSATDQLVILLVSQYMAGTDAYASLRADALCDLSRDNSDVAFFNEYSAVGVSLLSPTILSWWTDDGVHMSPDGAAYIAGLLWSACETAAHDWDTRRNVRRNRSARPFAMR